LAPIESAYETSYWSSTVTLVIFCGVQEIRLRAFVHRRPLFPYSSPILAKLSRFSVRSRPRSMLLGSAKYSSQANKLWNYFWWIPICVITIQQC